jgi:membrane protease YdiL (CAAX protease family)
MRSRDYHWWRPLLGLLLVAVVYTVAATVVVLAALLTGVTGPQMDLLDLTDPGVLLITNVSLIVAIPVVWLAWATAHGMRPGWSASVLGRLRRRLFAPLVWRALATIGVGIGLAVLLDVLTGGSTSRNAGPVAGFGWLLLVVLLTTPLQSAAEEYVFRGYLSQAIAAWVHRPRVGPVVAAVVTAALFSAAHAPPDVLTFLDRFAFGLAASAVTTLTGGLEAAIVLHATNNVLVFVLAGLSGSQVSTGSDSSTVGLLAVLLDVLAMAAYVAVVRLSRGRLRPETRTAALDLRVPAGPPVLQGPRRLLPAAAAWVPPPWSPAGVPLPPPGVPQLSPGPPPAPGERSPWARPD